MIWNGDPKGSPFFPYQKNPEHSLFPFLKKLSTLFPMQLNRKHVLDFFKNSTHEFVAQIISFCFLVWIFSNLFDYKEVSSYKFGEVFTVLAVVFLTVFLISSFGSMKSYLRSRWKDYDQMEVNKAIQSICNEYEAWANQFDHWTLKRMYFYRYTVQLLWHQLLAIALLYYFGLKLMLLFYLPVYLIAVKFFMLLNPKTEFLWLHPLPRNFWKKVNRYEKNLKDNFHQLNK